MRLPQFRRFLCAGLVALLAAGAQAAEPAPAAPVQPGAISEAERELSLLLLGNHVFTFMHEFGHALIDQLKLPVVGQEEDAVDEFATISLIAFARGEDTTPEAQRIFYEFALSGAKSLLKLWDLTTKGVGGQATKLPFWDEHGLDAKRFTNIMCLLYGSDPPRFKDIVQQLGMPEDRRDRCVADYPARDEAWSRLLAPHVAPETGAPPGSGKLTVQYGAAGSAFSQAVAADLQRLQVFEKLAEAIGTYLVLPNDIRIVHRDCGEPNAFWSPDDRSITMCYELVALMRELFTAPPQGQEGAAPAPPPAAEEQPIRPEPDLTSIETLFGAWQGTFSDPSTGAPVYVDLVLSPDGRFSQLSRVPATGFALHLWGRYQVFQGMIRYVYEGYEPRQYCGPTGYCSPIILPSGESVQIKLADRNTMVANGTYFHRVQ